MDDSQKHRRDFLGSVRDALELLLLDTALIEEKFKYFYVVDFAAIYGYMYKKSQLPFLAIPGESTDRTFARHQVALHMLFNKYPQPLLLIPPYSTELKNQIRTLTTDAKLAKLDASFLYKEKLLRLIAESDDFQNFVLLRSEPSSREVDEKLRNSALEIGKKHFPELYAAIACISVNGLETAQSLFRNDIL